MTALLVRGLSAFRGGSAGGSEPLFLPSKDGGVSFPLVIVGARLLEGMATGGLSFAFSVDWCLGLYFGEAGNT